MQQFIGRVIQAARDKTAKVAVERSVKQNKYLKVLKVLFNKLLNCVFRNKGR